MHTIIAYVLFPTTDEGTTKGVIVLMNPIYDMNSEETRSFRILVVASLMLGSFISFAFSI
jgi:hypothetical protein